MSLILVDRPCYYPTPDISWYCITAFDSISIEIFEDLNLKGCMQLWGQAQRDGNRLRPWWNSGRWGFDLEIWAASNAPKMLCSSGGVADDEAEDGENKQESGPTKKETRLVISMLTDLPHSSTLTADTQPWRSQKKRRNLKRRRGTWMPLVDVVTLIVQTCCRHFLFWPQWVLLMVRWQCDPGGQLQQVMTLAWNPWGRGNNLAAGARITAVHHKQLANCATPISLRYLSTWVAVANKRPLAPTESP